MPSIQQVIAEIQLATDLPPGHIAKAVQIIRDAEQRLKIKGVNSRPRKITNAKNLITLQEWEVVNGLLGAVMMEDWINAKGLCRFVILEMIQEFRGEMYAKGKQYANFKSAFMTYLNKGYLSKTLDGCKVERSPYQNKTILDKRGVTL